MPQEIIMRPLRASQRRGVANDGDLLRVGDDFKQNELGRSRSRSKTMWLRAVVISVVGDGRSYRVLPDGPHRTHRILRTYLEGIPKNCDSR